MICNYMIGGVILQNDWVRVPNAKAKPASQSKIQLYFRHFKMLRG